MTTNGTDTVTENDFVSMIKGPNFENVGGTEELTFTSFNNEANNAGLTAAQTTTLRNNILSLVRRYYEPFDVNIEVRSARTLQDVQRTLAARSTADAYTFLVGITPDTNTTDPPGGGILYGKAGGTEWGDGVFGNSSDDSAVVLVDNMFGLAGFNGVNGDTAIVAVAAHEAAHTFGLEHTQNHNGASADNLLLTTSDIIAQFANNTGDYQFFTRFDLPRTHRSGEYNPYARLAANVGTRGKAYVTGTGAFDKILIHKPGVYPFGPEDAVVTVEAYRDASYSSGSPR